MKLVTAFAIFNVIQFSNCFSPKTNPYYRQQGWMIQTVQAINSSTNHNNNNGQQQIVTRPSSWRTYAKNIDQLNNRRKRSSTLLYSSSSSSSSANDDVAVNEESKELAVNRAYIEGLLQNLSAALDRWIVNGSMNTRMRAYNIILQIRRETFDEELYKQATRMASRAGMPLDEPPTQSAMNNSNGHAAQRRKEEAEDRKKWERQRSTHLYESEKPIPKRGVTVQTGRSALSNRVASNGGKPDLFMPKIEKGLDPKEFADGKKALQDELKKEINGENYYNSNKSDEHANNALPQTDMDVAEAKTSEIIAKAGSGKAFNGDSLGIGGLDDVLSQVKRRIWVPLAAPPSLLKELGINPVRGLLLYGLPGCGKTLLARSLGQILSPARPLTIVSGPEIMDRFVGSSEANLREIFDNPPEIYDTYRIGTKDNGAAVQKAALHVIILDEFDAMARARGGRGGDQGDAGVARDSVVNQMLAKMDGVDPLPVPTLVIGELLSFFSHMI